VDPATSSTDASGEASTLWTVGTTAGDPQAAQAAATGVSGTVEFTATAEADVPPPANAEVSVVDNSFDPEAVTLATGGTVTWTWGGTVDHNVTFSSGPSSPSQTTGTFERTFNDTGVFDYQCSIHGSSMSGTITVVAPS
jgi:plastocyanin